MVSSINPSNAGGSVVGNCSLSFQGRVNNFIAARLHIGGLETNGTGENSTPLLRSGRDTGVLPLFASFSELKLTKHSFRRCNFHVEGRLGFVCTNLLS